MRATDFEFRHRFWIFGLLYFAGFVPYWFHDQNALTSLINAVNPGASERSVHIAFGIAAAVMFAAALLRTWATAYLSTEVMKHTQVQSSALVAEGPYRYVRNPLYLGNLLMTVSFGALASRIGAIIVIVGVTVFVLRLIGREEGELTAAQGESYRRFLAAVPRLFPSFTPRLPSSGRAPRWGQAFAGESMMWGFAITLLVFAFTLKTGPTFFIPLTLSIASSFFFRGRIDEAKANATAGK
jgi:protein-S-isoprenylcysteine O-methyltransferase Ste14